jgi:GT2 family glycosyltransferase
MLASVENHLGRLELFSFNETAGGFLFIGWVPHALANELASGEFVIRFESCDVGGNGVPAFYKRDPITEIGTGVVVFVAVPERPPGRPLALTTAAGRDRFAIPAAESIREFNADAPPPWFAGVLLEHLRPQFPDELLDALLPERAQPAGAVEVMAYEAALGGWLIAGWIPARGVAGGEALVRCSLGGVATLIPVRVVLHERPDLGGPGTGIVLFVRPPSGNSDEPRDMTVCSGTTTVRLEPPSSLRPCHGEEVVWDIRARVERAADSPERTELLRRLSTPRFAGETTLPSLSDFVRLFVDKTIACSPNGVVLMGWVLAEPGTLVELRLCSGRAAVPVDLAAAVRVSRVDVINATRHEHGLDDPMCGFVAFVPEGYSVCGPSYLAVETARGEIGYATLPPPRLHGLAAIREILGCHVQYANVAPAFEKVLGPSVARLNAVRLLERPAITQMQFGETPAVPIYSVIVPLYRRLEFMELQFALFGGEEMAGQCELIYVLDDPPRRDELEHLSGSIYGRFRIPFVIALLDRNMGFAPACNVGLGLARGRYVCFLNSDVFPQTGDWLGMLAARLEARPDLGVVGPLLLFDDGSVQHQGMTWRREPRFGNWYYNEHPRIGRRPLDQGGLLECPAITGACMMLRSEVARDVGGFDESYILGDFEDSDLCLQLRERGLGSAVDLDVRLVHLCRQSQHGGHDTWRHNLTLYNARIQHSRWESAISTALECPQYASTKSDATVKVT